MTTRSGKDGSPALRKEYAHSGNRRPLLRPMLTIAATVAALALSAVPAKATFPGSDGRIVFGSDRSGGTHNIFTMKPDGSDLRQLTFLTAAEGAALIASWSPDGTRIVFEERNPTATVRQIFVMNADGTNQHLLVHDPSFIDREPSFSPDGSRIAFARCSGSTSASPCAIYTARWDGRGITAVTHLSPGTFDGKPVYAPDGKTITFQSFDRGGVIAAVYTVNRDGSHLRRITPTAMEALSPDWAPDGSRLAVEGNCCDPLGPALFTVRPDGRDPVQITFPGAMADFWPTYSPSGAQIAFERDSADFSTSSVMAVNPNGSGLITLQAQAFEPNWGPGV
jgi:Tol biopolymer transport system component